MAVFFSDWKILTVVEDDEHEFDHSFGGAPIHRELVNAAFPVHLLYTLDLDDPLLTLPFHNSKRLPLYYCFSYDNGNMQVGYRVISEDRVEFYFDDSEGSSTRNFPYEDYPSEFPEIPVELEQEDFDPTDLDELKPMLNVFGFARLSDADRRQLMADWKYSYEEECPLEGEVWEGTDEDVVYYWAGPCCQGHPESPCPNPQCDNHERNRSLQIFAIVFGMPHEDVSLWGQWGESTQIIFEICPKCSAINVTNQCD